MEEKGGRKERVREEDILGRPVQSASLRVDV